MPDADRPVSGKRAAGAARELYRAATIVAGRRQRARHVFGRVLAAATGRDPEIVLRVPDDLRQSPFGTGVLAAHAAGLGLRLPSSASRLFSDVTTLRQVCGDYFRLPDCVPRPGELVIDAGANIGCYSAVLATLQPRAIVHAFEPLSSAFERLEATSRINGVGDRVLTNRVALGSAPGRVQLSTIWNGQQASLAPQLFDGGGRAGEMAEVVTLDAYVADRGLPPPAIMKLDVEGWEVEVAAGAARTLQGLRLLICEWHSHECIAEIIAATQAAGLAFVRSCSDDPSRLWGIGYFRRPPPAPLAGSD